MKLSLAQVQRRLAAAPLPLYFGGSFDPFHSGHRAIVEKLRACFPLCPLFVLPNRVSPFKSGGSDNLAISPDSGLNNAEKFAHRTALLQIVLAELQQNHPDCSLKLELCEWEREGPSFTADTLRLLLPKQMSMQSSQNAGKSCVLALGWDSFCTLHLWKDYGYLLENCIFVVFRRAPAMPKIPEKPAEQIGKSAEYTVLEFDNLCSSTGIRCALAGPRPFSAELARGLERYLGPGQLAYILQNGLYCYSKIL